MDEEKESLVGFLRQQRQRQARVLGCATMWHETEAEMAALLDSVDRVDVAESKLLHASSEDAFRFELHIVFDDAFNRDGSLNVFVHQLIGLLQLRQIQLQEMSPTPFGGQLIWKLAHGTKVHVYLKDKTKVRIKKRWSQLMYFAYFLGQEVLDKMNDGGSSREFFTNDLARTAAQNTFLLALDGDVVFEPDAIVKLVDLMKRDAAIGATCGRIHPQG
jgi:chitin synthase